MKPPLVLGRKSKLLLGLATCWPILYLGIFISFIVVNVFLGSFRSRPGSDGPPTAFLVIFALHFLTILWIFALFAIYVTYLFRTDRVKEDKKALWAVVLFMGNMIAMPIFFYLYVWRDPPV